MKALANEDQTTVTKAIKDIFDNFGSPKVLGCDRGSEFTNNAAVQLANSYKYQIKLGSVKNPQSQGTVECLNTTIIEMFRIMQATNREVTKN